MRYLIKQGTEKGTGLACQCRWNTCWIINLIDISFSFFVADDTALVNSTLNVWTMKIINDNLLK